MAEPVYIDEDVGHDDDSAVGTQTKPYKTLLHAMILHPPETAKYMTRKSETGPVSADGDPAARLEWKDASQSALKKATKLHAQHQKKQSKANDLAVRESAEGVRRQQLLEEAKKIIVEEDKSLPKAIRIRLHDQSSKIKLGSGDQKGTRVRVVGRVQHFRSQKDVIFITLRDGYGEMQCVLTGKFVKTYAMMTLTLETTIDIRGEIRSLPPGAHAPLDRELHADYFQVMGQALGDKDAITNKVQEDGDPQTLLDNRHLVLRGPKTIATMKVRAALQVAFQKTYEEREFRQVTPPCMVQTQVEGGSTLFKFDYYGQDAYLTQSSQLYLETCLPSLGDVFCMVPSFRAEKSLTRRHLSEFTHVEAELDFIDFEDLLVHLEDMMCRVVEITLANPEAAALIKQLNPTFKAPVRPFKRMRYSEAIDWLIANKIENEEGHPHTFGDDIAEAAERKMVDTLGVPIFLTHFPVPIKSFYMQKDPLDPRVTESVDCLVSLSL